MSQHLFNLYYNFWFNFTKKKISKFFLQEIIQKLTKSFIYIVILKLIHLPRIN